MQIRIETSPEKKMVGKCMRMSLANNKTGELWRSFMMERKSITNCVTNDLYSLQVYEPGHFEHFDPKREFIKWALAEVDGFNTVSEGMERFNLSGGLYAVFQHKGSSADSSTFQYIFSTWLPSSDYVLDNRPHFEVLGEKYKNGSPDSEEEIWIPVRPR